MYDNVEFSIFYLKFIDMDIYPNLRNNAIKVSLRVVITLL